jgi:antiviral helicase SKI2
LQFEEEEVKQESDTIKKDTTFNIEDMMAPDNNTYDFLNVKLEPVNKVTAAELKSEQEPTESDELDSLLPTSLPPQKDLAPKKLTQTVNESVKRREWAHEINVNEPFDNFYDLVPEMAMQVSPLNSAIVSEEYLSPLL